MQKVKRESSEKLSTSVITLSQRTNCTPISALSAFGGFLGDQILDGVERLLPWSPPRTEAIHAALSYSRGVCGETIAFLGR